MQFSVTFRHMEATEALKDYAKERIQRIKKYFPDPIAVHVVMSTERRYNHRADVNVQLHNGLKIAGHESTENMYSSLDLVVAKLERQCRKYKDKLRAHKGRSDFEAITWTHSVLSESTEQAPPAGDAADAVVEQPPEKSPVVARTERFHAEPMSASQAIMQLNLLHEQFLVYRCDQSGQVNVVYRRGDGSFGLIEPPPAA